MITTFMIRYIIKNIMIFVVSFYPYKRKRKIFLEKIGFGDYQIFEGYKIMEVE